MVMMNKDQSGVRDQRFVRDRGGWTSEFRVGRAGYELPGGGSSWLDSRLGLLTAATGVDILSGSDVSRCVDENRNECVCVCVCVVVFYEFEVDLDYRLLGDRER